MSELADDQSQDQAVDNPADRLVSIAVAIIIGVVGVAVFMVQPIYLGALADHLFYTNEQLGLIAGVELSGSALAGFAALYSFYGGLKAVALTDIIQVVILIIGGFVITWLALDALPADGALGGPGLLAQEMPGHFEMILDEQGWNAIVSGLADDPYC